MAEFNHIPNKRNVLITTCPRQDMERVWKCEGTNPMEVISKPFYPSSLKSPTPILPQIAVYQNFLLLPSKFPCQRTARIYFPKNRRTDISEFTHYIPGDVLIYNWQQSEVSLLTLTSGRFMKMGLLQWCPVQRKQRVTTLVQSPT